MLWSNRDASTQRARPSYFDRWPWTAIHTGALIRKVPRGQTLDGLEEAEAAISKTTASTTKRPDARR
jgi:hypothetical protein